MTSYITKTPRASLTLEITDDLTQEEWDTLTASLAALYVVAVPEGARTVTRLLEGIPGPGKTGILPCATDELSTMTQEATQDAWITPKDDNTETFRGPLDASVMGLRLAVGDIATVTRSHTEAHVGTMHRWAKESAAPVRYVCGHGGCNASAIVTEEPF